MLKDKDSALALKDKELDLNTLQSKLALSQKDLQLLR
jgi:hypothetical protein